MMHIPAIHAGFSPEQKAEVWRLVDSLRKSLDDLSPLLKECGTFIAVENMW